MEAKIALCEKIEAFDYSNLNTYKAWDDATRIVLAWQDEWRTIGFAPRKVNQKLFDRYRKGCDAFFDAKAVFYKASKNILAQNLEKKKALCEQAEALKDSVEWKETSEKLIQLQKDWRTIGPVSKNYPTTFGSVLLLPVIISSNRKIKILQDKEVLKLII